MESQGRGGEHGRLLILKVGTALVTTKAGRLDYNSIAGVASSIAALKGQGWRVVLVTSGAVASGRIFDDAPDQPLKGVPEKSRRQFLAAVGQPRLMEFYTHVFVRSGLKLAQILITASAFAERDQYISVRDTLLALLAKGVVPVVNDNDVLHSDAEPGFSDNDQLAAFLGGMLQADHVILLTSQDGIFAGFPNHTENDLVEQVTCDDEQLARLTALVGSPGAGGRGGMQSKLKAGFLLGWMGIPLTIANGRRENAAVQALDGTLRCTRFLPREGVRLSGIRKWLSSGAVPRGTVVVSAVGGSVIRQVGRRGSLLAAGIEAVEGEFDTGDAVRIVDANRRLFGYGITRVSSQLLALIKGKSSDEIHALIADNRVPQGSDEIIVHADYFFGTNHGYF